VDKFFSKKSGVLLKLATGQAIYFVNKINWIYNLNEIQEKIFRIKKIFNPDMFKSSI
jgi:hypothetical protein